VRPELPRVRAGAIPLAREEPNMANNRLQILKIPNKAVPEAHPINGVGAGEGTN
jgi:hypothetical protein